MKRSLRSLRSLLIAGVLLVLLATPAGAHTALVASEPAAGSEVATLERIVLRFGSRVEASVSHVWLEDDGGVLPLESPHHLDGDDRTVVVDVPPIAEGLYRIGWHVVAADGDPLSGAIPFSFGSPVVGGAAAAEALTGTDPVTTDATAAHTSGVPAAVARMLLDASLATLLGGLAFVATVWPQGASSSDTRRLLWGAAVAAALASFVLAVLQHAHAEGLTLTQALAADHLRASLGHRFGRIAVLRLGLLVAAGWLTTRLAHGGARTARSIPWCGATGAVALGLFETVVLLGHSGEASGLDGAARLVHTVGVSAWLGGLLMLLVVVLPRRRSDELAALLPRFSMLATVAVGSLVVAGVLLSVDLVGAARALPTTAYGRILLLKVVAVVVLLIAAARSRDHVRRRVEVSARSAAGPLAALVSLELGLLTVVLGLTALLVTQTPPS